MYYGVVVILIDTLISIEFPLCIVIPWSWPNQSILKEQGTKDFPSFIPCSIPQGRTVRVPLVSSSPYPASAKRNLGIRSPGSSSLDVALRAMPLDEVGAYVCKNGINSPRLPRKALRGNYGDFYWCAPPPLDSETGWTGELWLKTNLFQLAKVSG